MLQHKVEWEFHSEIRTLKSGDTTQGFVSYAAVLREIEDDVIPGGILNGMHRLAFFGEQWMKTNAPWTDRTTDARTGLAADVEQEGDAWRVVLHGGVDYQFWLETRWNGRFAVIGPAQAVLSGRAFEIIANNILLDLRGQGSQFRHRETGRFT